MPYFIRLDRDEKDKYQDIFDIHQVEIGSLIQEIEKQKTHFDKIIDHMTVTTSKSHRCTKRGLIMGFLAFLFGGNSHSGTINQIKENLEILEQNQGLLADEMINQLRLINNQNVQISQNRAVLNSLNRELIQLNNSINGITESVKALTFSRNFLLAMLQT